MKRDAWSPSCPLPLERYPQIVLAHGGGGTLMHELIDGLFSFGQDAHDSAVLELPVRPIAFTTDSYVVRPLFFPGGDIGKLAVFGTVNDLAMSGAMAQLLSLGFILEEGLAIDLLWRIVQSIKESAEACGVRIVTGDTKVVEKGKGDGVYLNSSGLGVREHDLIIHPAQIRSGDQVIVSGDLGRHGIAVLSAREGVEFQSSVLSDCAPLKEQVRALLDAGIEVHCLRDLTRGGLVSALSELASSARVGITVEEQRIPVCEAVRGACELLGFDPLYVANEGRFAAFVAPEHAERAAAILRRFDCAAAVVGTVRESGGVQLRTRLGSLRALDMLSGEQLPRIC